MCGNGGADTRRASGCLPGLMVNTDQRCRRSSAFFLHTSCVAETLFLSLWKMQWPFGLLYLLHSEVAGWRSGSCRLPSKGHGTGSQLGTGVKKRVSKPGCCFHSWHVPLTSLGLQFVLVTSWNLTHTSASVITDIKKITGDRPAGCLQWVKVLAIKPDDLTSIPRTYMVEEKQYNS